MAILATIREDLVSSYLFWQMNWNLQFMNLIYESINNIHNLSPNLDLGTHVPWPVASSGRVDHLMTIFTSLLITWMVKRITAVALATPAQLDLCVRQKSLILKTSLFFPICYGGILRGEKVFFSNSKILTNARLWYLILNKQHFFSVEGVEMFYRISTELEESGLNRCLSYFFC